jgi:hypothetical protein
MHQTTLPATAASSSALPTKRGGSASSLFSRSNSSAGSLFATTGFAPSSSCHQLRKITSSLTKLQRQANFNVSSDLDDTASIVDGEGLENYFKDVEEPATKATKDFLRSPSVREKKLLGRRLRSLEEHTNEEKESCFTSLAVSVPDKNPKIVQMEEERLEATPVPPTLIVPQKSRSNPSTPEQCIPCEENRGNDLPNKGRGEMLSPVPSNVDEVNHVRTRSLLQVLENTCTTYLDMLCPCRGQLAEAALSCLESVDVDASISS